MIHENLEIVIGIGIRDGLKLYAKHDFNLLMIAMLPEDTNTHRLISSIRQVTPIPIVLIVPFEDSKEIARAYYSGVDAYLTDPLDIDVIAAMLTAQYRRLARLMHMDDARNIPMIVREDFIIHPKTRTIKRKGEEIVLTSMEFNLLYYLARNSDIIISHNQICEYVWRSESTCNDSLTSRIYRLRKKIEPDPKHPIYIKSVYNAGYTFSTK